MVSRYDVVLALIPVLVLGGLAVGRSIRAVETAFGVGGRLAVIPFAVIGLVAALCVIGRELLVVGHPSE